MKTFIILLIHITAGLGFLAIALSTLAMVLPKGQPHGYTEKRAPYTAVQHEAGTPASLRDQAT
jgi:hypothetical protein